MSLRQSSFKSPDTTSFSRPSLMEDSYPSSSVKSHALPSSESQPTALTPRKATLLGIRPCKATGRKSVNSLKGSGTLRITCQTLLVSRSDTVTALRSASSRNNEATALVPLRNGHAPTIRELPAAPLIWSFTVSVQVLESFCSASDLSTTARRKFFCASNSSALPSPSTSAAL